MNVCVFCASSQEVEKIYFDEANYLGQLLAEHNHQLIYGGANIGLMGELARSVKHHNGKVIGVMPQKLVDRERANTDVDEFIITDNMYDRKRKMSELAEAYIALPGGFGTFEELFEVLTLKQLAYHDKPIIIISTNGFYDKLQILIQSIISKQFASESFHDLYEIVDSSDEAIQLLKAYQIKNNLS